VTFADPPAFVERYVAQMDHAVPTTLKNEHETDGGHAGQSKAMKLTAEFSKEEALLHRVFFDGASPDIILRLFSHPEKAQRVKIASALAAVNSEFTHDEESGFAEKREQFWVDVEAHLPNIQNALFEALITSAEEGVANHIPYTLAWMRGQDAKTVELLSWSAKHHPDTWVRKFSTFFVIQFGENEELASELISNGAHDPDYRVRKEVLDQRFRRFVEKFQIN